MALNQKQIENFKTGKKTSLSDGKGLLLEISPTGVKRWYFRYRLANHTRWMPLGYFPALSLAKARAEAAVQLTFVREGKDPLTQREAERASVLLAKKEAEHAAMIASSRLTFTQLFERWCQGQLLKGRKDGGAEISRSFQKDVLPRIGQLYADQVTRQQIASLLHDIVGRGAGRMANLTLSNLRQCFGWAIGAGLLEIDPTSHLKKESFGGKEIERDRTLSDDELRALLQSSLPLSNLSQKAKAAVRILLATGARVGELLCAKREHINPELREWHLPDTKNGKPHLIQLSDFALVAFNEILSFREHSIWIFPNRVGSDHVCEKTLTKQIGDRQRAGKEPMSARSKDSTSLILPGGRWTPHDLRRTASTQMGELGVRPDIIERCLNHVEENKVKRTYQRQMLLPERKAAFEVLGARLEILADPNSNNVLLLNVTS